MRISTESQTVTAEIISNENDRLKVLPALFGNHYLQGEALVYTVTRKHTAEYEGGYWNYYALSNGGYYLAPDLGDEPLTISVPGNSFKGELSPDATGIVSTLFALGILMQEVETDEHPHLVEQYDRLKEFACEHPEYKAILEAID